MKINGLKSLAPVGPHIEGIIRFSYEERLPGEREQLPQFELLTRVHDKVPAVGEIPRMTTHPIAETLIHRDAKEEGHRLIKEIPIRFLGATPESIMTARYQAFETSSGRMLCAGDGVKAVQREDGASPVRETGCTGPESCAFANRPGVTCNLHCRMKVQVEGSTDPLAVFEFQSSGINTYRTLASKLQMLHAIYGNLRGLPFKLTSWAKSSSQSLYKPFFCANIELRDGETLGKLKVAEDDPFSGLSPEILSRLEEVMVKMSRDSIFDLDGAESMVTTWTPASIIASSRSRPEAGVSAVSATQELSNIIQRAKTQPKEVNIEPLPTELDLSTNVHAQEGEKITQTSPEPVSVAFMEEPDNLCI